MLTDELSQFELSRPPYIHLKYTLESPRADSFAIKVSNGDEIKELSVHELLQLKQEQLACVASVAISIEDSKGSWT